MASMCRRRRRNRQTRDLSTGFRESERARASYRDFIPGSPSPLPPSILIAEDTTLMSKTPEYSLLAISTSACAPHHRCTWYGRSGETREHLSRGVKCLSISILDGSSQLSTQHFADIRRADSTPHRWLSWIWQVITTFIMGYLRRSEIMRAECLSRAPCHSGKYCRAIGLAAPSLIGPIALDDLSCRPSNIVTWAVVSVQVILYRSIHS